RWLPEAPMEAASTRPRRWVSGRDGSASSTSIQATDPRQRGPLDLGRLQRRDLQLSRVGRRARRARARLFDEIDTEVLVHLYEQPESLASTGCGACSRSLKWDEPATPEGVVFGSELKALTQSPWDGRPGGVLPRAARRLFMSTPGSVPSLALPL